MPSLGIRISQELHGRLNDVALAEGMSVSDFVRRSVEQALDDRLTPSNSNGNGKLVEHLESQIQKKDEQIDQLHQLVAMAQQNAGDLTKQLEDKRQNGSWWRFWGRG